MSGKILRGKSKQTETVFKLSFWSSTTTNMLLYQRSQEIVSNINKTA